MLSKKVIAAARYVAAGGFTPADLFTASEVGVWYDPSDLSTLWQDTAGTTAVTADGQSVARIDDKSGNGLNATQATAGLRPLYKTAGGLHWLQFDGSDDVMRVAYGLSFTNITLGVAYLLSAAHFVVDDNDTANHAGIYSSADGSLRWGIRGSLSSNALTATGGWTRGAEQVVVASASDAAALEITGSGNSASSTAQGAPTDLTGITLGATASDALKLNGKIYSLVSINRVVTGAERTDLETYLADQSGVTL